MGPVKAEPAKRAPGGWSNIGERWDAMQTISSSKSNRKNRLYLRFQIFILAAAIALGACSDPLWEPPVSGSVMAERTNPVNSLLARVIASKTKGTYTFEVRDIRKGNALAERTIAVPVGYHEHIVSLMWSGDSRIVTATIDHDFGGDNRVFDLRTEHTDA